MKKQIYNWALALGFPALLTGMGILSAILPSKGFSESENRYLQKKPDFSWMALLDGSFGENYEAYLSDQFPGRNGWVGVKSLAERLAGKTDSNGVYFGKDGYLIEKFEKEDLEGGQLDRNLKVLAQALDRMAQEYGKQHVRVMLVPGATQILKDKLPLFAAPYNQAQVVQELMKEGDTPEMVVQVEAALGEHRDEELYYRTDHHWTSTGAYYGYVAWMESLGMEPWEAEMFTVAPVSSDFYGTLQAKVQGFRKPDEIKLYQPKEPVEYSVEYDGNGIWTDGLYQYGALGTRDQYSVFLDGNHGLTRIRNLMGTGAEERKGRKLLMIKDSYAHSFAPFAVNHFEETMMVDLRYFNLDVEEFAREEGVTDILILYRIPGFATEKTVSKLAKARPEGTVAEVTYKAAPAPTLAK